MRFTAYQNGRKIERALRSKKEWEDLVRGLNLSTETVDAPYTEIVIKDANRRVVFKQEADPTFDDMMAMYRKESARKTFAIMARVSEATRRYK